MHSIDAKTGCLRATEMTADPDRDDLSTAAALVWTSPSPLYLRMVLAKRHARKRTEAR